MKNILIVLLSIVLITGCGCSKNDSTEKNNRVDKGVIKNQAFEGLEFVNVGYKDGVIKTVVINNTGYTYEGSKFKMIVMDENGSVITEEIDTVNGKVETGTTKEIKTKTKADLSKAVSIEYSIVNE